MWGYKEQNLYRLSTFTADITVQSVLGDSDNECSDNYGINPNLSIIYLDVNHNCFDRHTIDNYHWQLTVKLSMSAEQIFLSQRQMDLLLYRLVKLTSQWSTDFNEK